MVKFAFMAEEKFESVWIYINTSNAYPDWVKIGRTKNLDERRSQYNAASPLKEHNLEPVICCASLNDAHIIEQTVLAILARTFETKGEWVKCTPRIARNEIFIQYELQQEYNDIVVDDKLVLKLEQLSSYEKYSLALKRIDFWESIKRSCCGRITIDDLLPTLEQKILSNECTFEVITYREQFCVKINLKALVYDPAILKRFGEKVVMNFFRGEPFFKKQIGYDFILSLEHSKFPDKVKNLILKDGVEENITYFFNNLHSLREHWNIFKQGDKYILVVAPTVYSQLPNQTDLKLIKDAFIKLPNVIATSVVKRVGGKPHRCLLINLDDQHLNIMRQSGLVLDF